MVVVLEGLVVVVVLEGLLLLVLVVLEGLVAVLHAVCDEGGIGFGVVFVEGNGGEGWCRRRWVGGRTAGNWRGVGVDWAAGNGARRVRPRGGGCCGREGAAEGGVAGEDAFARGRWEVQARRRGEGRGRVEDLHVDLIGPLEGFEQLGDLGGLGVLLFKDAEDGHGDGEDVDEAGGC